MNSAKSEMLDIKNKTIGGVFFEAATTWPEAIFFISPKTLVTPMLELSYSKALKRVNVYEHNFKKAGYGSGDRVALLLGNRVEHYLIKIAANNLGISIVPLNPDSSPSEVIYILNDSNSILLISDKNHIDLVNDINKKYSKYIEVFDVDSLKNLVPKHNKNSNWMNITSKSESSLLYTSGTTGHPKGCIMSHEYELMCGDSYRSIGPPVQLAINKDRIFNPLPSFHINAGVVTFIGSILTGNCLIQPMRFSASTWWQDIKDTKATIFHYLGVVISVILKTLKETDVDLSLLRLGLGAGVEPALHREFEDKFQIPLVEIWGMTEMCRIIAACDEPRLIHTRAMGRPRKGLEIKVVDDNGKEVPHGSQGEMLTRHSEKTPRKGAFSGYLGKPQETEIAWRGGWFHTGDTVIMDQTKMLYFVDRKKNIIRRAGENVAAAEIENCLLEHSLVLAVACLAVPDSIREEEILSCIILSGNSLKSEILAKSLFTHVYNRLAYFKAPGWILFVDELPITSTQKILKHKMFPNNEDPLMKPNIFDFRDSKIRKNRKEKH